MRILLAYSGGLDTSYLTALLTQQGHAVTTCIIDCGGADATELEQIGVRALRYGAAQHLCLDGRTSLYQRVLRWLLVAHVRRGQAYPLSVGAERGLQAEMLARYASDHGFDALAHGCTAAGNDQIRFDAALRVIAPQLQVLAPIRDAAPSRAEQLQWLRDQELPLPQAGGEYSINAGLWGVTIGGGELLHSHQGLPESAWLWTRREAPTPQAAPLQIQFDQGHPVALDGQALDPVELITRLNLRAGQAGIGRGYHLGDTVLGIKGRIAYEAPAAEVLIHAHRELEKLVLTEDQRFWKDHLGEVYGRRLHQGLFHDPVLRDFEAMFASTQERVCGHVTLSLDHGQVLASGLDSPFSLMDASDAAYGERSASDSDPAGLRGLAQVLAEPARLYARMAP